MNYKLCIYAVCKNEQDNVQNWVKNHINADYLYLLDTGSTDNTVILGRKELGNKGQIDMYENVEDLKYAGYFNFGKAKDISFQNAKAICKGPEWIFLNLDLDEFLVEGSVEAIKDAWTEDTKLGTLYLGDLYKFRLHSGDDDIHWTSPIHEYLLYKNYTCFNAPNVLHINAAFNHFSTPENYDKYKAQLTAIIKKNPKSVWLSFWNEINYTDHAEWAQNCLNLLVSSEEDPFYRDPEMLFFLQYLLMPYLTHEQKLQIFSDLETFIDAGNIPAMRQFYYRYGLELETEDFEKAKEYFKKCASVESQFKNLFKIDDAFFYSEQFNNILKHKLELDHRNKICVYAICKNEAKFVKKWIDSMSEADYIVVLDTGSTDNTVELLQADPRVTKVVSNKITPWRFDVARNESMKLIPEDTDVCVCTDLDELFEPNWAASLRELWYPGLSRLFYKYIWNHNADGTPGKTFYYDKIHSKTNHKWFYPIHEACWRISDEGEMEIEQTGQVLRTDNIVLHHFQDIKKPRASYLDLLKVRAEENADDPFSAYYLAREYNDHLYPEDGIVWYKKCIELYDQKGPDFVDAFNMHAPACIFVGDSEFSQLHFEEAQKYYEKALKLDSGLYIAYIRMGDIYFAKQQYSIAEGFVRDGFKNRRAIPYGTDPAVDPGIGNFFIAKCKAAQEDYQEAEIYCKAAIEECGFNVPAMYNELLAGIQQQLNH